MAKRQVVFYVCLFVVLLVPSVYGAATIADIYAAPSESFRLYGTTNTTCQNGITLAECPDSQYPSISDTYTVWGDGSTSAASGASVQDKGNTQTAIARVVYDVDGLYQGTYKLRFAVASSTKTYNYTVCTYLDDLEYVNQSSCIDLQHVADGNNWEEGVIDAIVRESALRFNNRVYLRIFVKDADAIDSITITEIYLRRPFASSDFSIIAEGVSEVEAGTRAENTWSIVSQAELPQITNYSCEIHRLNPINDTVSETYVNISLLDVEYQVDSDAGFFRVYWDANTSVDLVDEGFNYEVSCSGFLGDVYFEEFNQYVYINRERTLWMTIADFIDYFLEIIGLLNDIDETTTVTQQVVNISSYTVDVAGGQAIYGDTSYLTTWVGGPLGIFTGAACDSQVLYPNGTLFAERSHVETVNGVYVANVTWPDTGTYRVLSNCSYVNDTVRGSGVWNVRAPSAEEQYVMEMIS